jgi:UDP-glucose 4-epimerase
MKNKYKILVTGVAGFLGSHLSEQLANLGHEVIGIDNMIGGYKDNVPKNIKFHNIDCCNFEEVEGIMSGINIVYHCAATAHEGLSVFSPFEITKNNYLASVSIFSAAINNRVKRIIFCSSMARYGDSVTPFLESMKPSPVDPYAISKVAAEDVLINLCELNNTEWVIAVPHNIIGPRQKYDDPFRNVVSIMINRMLQGKAPIIYGDGEQKRCFSYIDDCLSCLLPMLDQKNLNKQIINIGPDEEFVTINQISEICSNITGVNLPPIYKPGRPREVKIEIKNELTPKTWTQKEI